jgi:hypothetical protein
MSTPEPEPPSPTSVRRHYAPSAAATPPRDMTTAPAPPPARSSPLASLAGRVASLPDGPVNALCGAVAGVASGIVTCPLDVIKTRLQAQGSFRPRMYTGPTRAVYKGLTGTARVIWTQDGVRGLYRGLGPMLLGYIPTWAVYMSTYESTKEFLNTRMGQCPLGAIAPKSLTDPAQRTSGSHGRSPPLPPAGARHWSPIPSGWSRRDSCRRSAPAPPKTTVRHGTTHSTPSGPCTPKKALPRSTRASPPPCWGLLMWPFSSRCTSI